VLGRRNGGGDGGARPRNVETTGREYLFAPAIFSHIFACCSFVVMLPTYSYNVTLSWYYR